MKFRIGPDIEDFDLAASYVQMEARLAKQSVKQCTRCGTSRFLELRVYAAPSARPEAWRKEWYVKCRGCGISSEPALDTGRAFIAWNTLVRLESGAFRRVG